MSWSELKTYVTLSKALTEEEKCGFTRVELSRKKKKKKRELPWDGLDEKAEN